MRIRDREVRSIVKAPFQVRHWAALERMLVTYERPAPALLRYALNCGRYPWVPSLRTPLGLVRPCLESYHDLLTVNEVFCRRDYGDAADLGVVVDIGANVGLAALYFLTRSTRVRVWCYEPDPSNLLRLRRTLAGFEDRVHVEQAAVCPDPAPVEVPFAPRGRYGRVLDSEETGTIRVPARGISDVISAVLESEGRVDLLKIDTEGSEPALVAAISPAQRRYVDALVYEGPGGVVTWDDGH